MKQEVSGYALAIQTIMVDGAAGEVELQVYEGGNGSYFAVDGSWLEQCTEDDKQLFIPDPYNEGYSIRLVDTEEEIKQKRATLVSGNADEYNDVINDVINQIRRDAENFDFTVLEELLEFLPEHVLRNYLPETKRI